MKKIGLLLPRSTYYASIGHDIHQGLKQGFFAQNNDQLHQPQLVSENIGFGTDPQLCYNLVEKMLLISEIELVIAYISHKTAQMIRPLFKAVNKILIVLDSGANLPQEWPRSSNTLYHSLHNSLGNFLVSQMAAQKGLTKAVNVTGYYDGGYLHSHAGYIGFSEAGGTILYNHATGYRRDDFNLSELKKWFDSGNSADCLLSLFSGDYIQWYFEELKADFSPDQFTIILPPFGLEESVLAESPFPNQRLLGLASWSEKLLNAENQVFIDRMLSSGKSANLFSLLGYEASLLASSILELMEKCHHNGKEVCKDIMAMEFQTPRGKLLFDQATQTSMAPMYQTKVIPDEKGMCQLEIIGAININQIQEAYRKMVSKPLNNATSGWVNSYTCI